MSKNKLLIVIVGPTAVGKTSLCVQVAKAFDCEVVSADSRQFYREMAVGTAKPTLEEMEGVPHHFVDFLPVENEMSAGSFETLALKKIDELFQEYDIAILTGGSGLYINAVCDGMSEMPTPPPEIRNELMKELETNGLEKLLEELEEKDPEYFNQVDQNNHQRVVRALEMIRFSGKPFSSFRVGQKKERDFSILKIGLTMDRKELYHRIDARVDIMLQNGLEDEMRELYPKKNLNSLQTVGYKEFFGSLDGEYDWEEAIRLVKRNTRRYAKRQLTWFNKDEDIRWFHPKDLNKVIAYIKQSIILAKNL